MHEQATHTTSFGSPGMATPTFDVAATTEGIYRAAYDLFEAELTADAAALFRLMLLAAPQDGRGWLGLGHCHRRLEQPALARSVWQAGLSVATEPEALDAALSTLDEEEPRP